MEYVCIEGEKASIDLTQNCQPCEKVRHFISLIGVSDIYIVVNLWCLLNRLLNLTSFNRLLKILKKCEIVERKENTKTSMIHCFIFVGLC